MLEQGLPIVSGNTENGNTEHEPVLEQGLPNCFLQVGKRSTERETGLEGGLHRRLGRLKLERKTTQFRRHSCCTTSCCTRGVAVAVRATNGTEGYLHQSFPFSATSKLPKDRSILLKLLTRTCNKDLHSYIPLPTPHSFRIGSKRPLHRTEASDPQSDETGIASSSSSLPSYRHHVESRLFAHTVLHHTASDLLARHELGSPCLIISYHTILLLVLCITVMFIIIIIPADLDGLQAGVTDINLYLSFPALFWSQEACLRLKTDRPL